LQGGLASQWQAGLMISSDSQAAGIGRNRLDTHQAPSSEKFLAKGKIDNLVVESFCVCGLKLIF
jgi:hypothetical protein